MALQGRYIKIVQTTFIVLLVILTTLIFLNSPGAGDVKYFISWAKNAESSGLISGFKASAEQYPPLSLGILLVAIKVSNLFGLGGFYAVKMSILFLLFLTSFLFWLWTRDFTLTVILHLSLILNSAILGYIDVFFAPTLLLSLWALKQRKLTLFAVFFSISVLTKWQPIIIAPFLAIYILNIHKVAQWRQIKYKELIGKVIFPVSIIIIVALSIFGITLVYTFLSATSSMFLSGNALNFNWILTHLLNVLYPDRFGGLLNGQAQYINNPPLEVIFIPKLLFYSSYVITAVTFFKREKTFENLIIFSLLGYLAYFIFNTDVHENHLFLVTILSIILFWVDRKHLPAMFILVLMSNINLLIFSGIGGNGMKFSRVIGGIDIALLLSILNVGYFLFFWVTNILQRKDSVAVQEPQSENLIKAGL
jgi:hypothetical protein